MVRWLGRLLLDSSSSLLVTLVRPELFRHFRITPTTQTVPTMPVITRNIARGTTGRRTATEQSSPVKTETKKAAEAVLRTHQLFTDYGGFDSFGLSSAFEFQVGLSCDNESLIQLK